MTREELLPFNQQAVQITYIREVENYGKHRDKLSYAGKVLQVTDKMVKFSPFGMNGYWIAFEDILSVEPIKIPD